MFYYGELATQIYQNNISVRAILHQFCGMLIWNVPGLNYAGLLLSFISGLDYKSTISLFNVFSLGRFTFNKWLYLYVTLGHVVIV